MTTTTTPRTGVDREMAQREAALANNPERAAVISAARRFKASWFELGEALVRIRRGDTWKSWGYSSFEDYCKKELHLRQETADKLTGSYSFLRSRAPKVVERAFSNTVEEEESPLPAYQAVDFWRRADESEAPRDTVEEIGKQVLGGASVSHINRQFKEVVFPLDEASQKEKRRSELRHATAKLTELLALGREEGLVPVNLSAELEEPLQRLAELVGKKRESAAA